MYNSSTLKMPFKQISLIGVASGWGAQNKDTEYGPIFIKKNFHKIQNEIAKSDINIYWEKIIYPKKMFKDFRKDLTFSEKEELILNVTKELSKQIVYNVKQEKFIIVIGGDHSIATGTWDGISKAYDCSDQLGLIWIDAHMDSHLPETSISKAIHGMPIPMLMGYSNSRISKELLKNKKIINPKNIILIGIRSFETAEESFLRKLGVKIYYINDVIKNGFKPIFLESIDYLISKTKFIGVSIDIDAFDPSYAPGTGSPEKNGILPNDFYNTIKEISFLNTFVALEIVEFNPNLDRDLMTFNIIKDIIKYCIK